MKFFIFIDLFLNFLLINGQNLRNLILTMNAEKLKKLSDIATKTVYQLFETTLDFKGRSFVKYEDEEKKIEVSLYDDQEIPDVEEQFRFDINNWTPIIPEISMNLSKLYLFGQTFDIKEQYKQMANSIANAIENGFVINYQKDGKDILSSNRFKCFVNDNDGNDGSFEISVADKNDFEILYEAAEGWYEENKDDPNIKKYKPIASGVLKFIGVVKDIYNNHKKKKNASTFLKIPFFALLLIFGIL